MDNNTVLVIGGDMRFTYAAQYLASSGLTVHTVYDGNTDSNEELGTLLNTAGRIILPLPASKDRININTPLSDKLLSIKEFSEMSGAGRRIYGGMIGTDFKALLEANGDSVTDYFRREELQIRNAVPTAEGVVGIITGTLPFTVHSCPIAVTGYGRCAKAAARLLKAMGAEVTVTARNPADLAAADCDGMKTCFLSDFGQICNRFAVIVNTVPSMIIGEKIIQSLDKDCVITDIASAPFGTDFEKAREYGIKAIKASSLPGKTAPKTAGKIIAQTILQIIREE